MMLSELIPLLESTGYPVAYGSFASVQQPPYIVYIEGYSKNVSANNKVVLKAENYQIELYTAKRDLVAESKVEDALKNIFYDSTSSFIESIKLFQKIYEIQIIGG